MSINIPMNKGQVKTNLRKTRMSDHHNQWSDREERKEAET